jgi:DNA-binding response OmpR family regulator
MRSDAIDAQPGSRPQEIDLLPTRQRMTRVTVKLTIRELELLTSLASDQVFRREFIDTKMPGYRAKPDEVDLGKAIVERLRSLRKSVSAG